MEDKFEHYQEILPSDDCIPLFGIRLLAYYNDRGVLAFQMVSDQEVKVPLSTTIGILEMAKHEMMLMNTIGSLKDKKEE